MKLRMIRTMASLTCVVTAVALLVIGCGSPSQDDKKDNKVVKGEDDPKKKVGNSGKADPGTISRQTIAEFVQKCKKDGNPSIGTAYEISGNVKEVDWFFRNWVHISGKLRFSLGDVNIL